MFTSLLCNNSTACSVCDEDRRWWWRIIPKVEYDTTTMKKKEKKNDEDEDNEKSSQPSSSQQFCLAELMLCLASVPFPSWWYALLRFVGSAFRRSRVDAMLRFGAVFGSELMLCFGLGMTLSLLITVVYSEVTPGREGWGLGSLFVLQDEDATADDLLLSMTIYIVSWHRWRARWPSQVGAMLCFGAAFPSWCYARLRFGDRLGRFDFPESMLCFA